MLPRYDENRRLIGLFRAKTVTLVSQELLDGKTITIELFNPDQSPRGRLNLTKARYDQKQGTVHAAAATQLALDTFHATGTGLAFVIDRSEGVLTGPVHSWITPLPKTAMRPAPAPLRATALLGASLLVLPISTAGSAPLAAAALPVPPAAVEPEPTTIPSPQRLIEVNAEIREHLRSALAASATATQAAAAFLDAEDLLAKNPPATPEPQPEPKVIDVKPSPDSTIIDCDGGMYFDGKMGVLVYLKNVTVDDPRLTLTGANDIKVFFEKKPPKTDSAANPDQPSEPAPSQQKPDKKPDKKPELGGMAANLGEVERIVATGSLYLVQKPKGNDEPIEATCNILTYNLKTGEILLSGKPVFKQGGRINAGKRPDQTVRIINNTATFSPGGTRTILPTTGINGVSPR